ncbi:MAG: hypothetical protein ACKVH8_14735 [Pirellulales bacterium]
MKGLNSMIDKIKNFFLAKWSEFFPESKIPPPPFKASKRVATIMYGLWYGRMTPDQARTQARDWGFSDDTIENMITRATVEPSYWSQQTSSERNNNEQNG